MAELSCDDLLRHLAAYLDEEAATALGAEIEHHLAECDDCRDVVARLRQTARFYRLAPRPAFPAAARERLYQALDLSEFLSRPAS